MLDSPAFAVTRKPGRFSIFAQPLERAAAIAYFLGAVVPLGALAWVVLRWVRPGETMADPSWFILMLGLIGLLSLLSFFALRRAARMVIQLLDRENRSLARLVTVSRELAAATEDHEVVALAAQAAAEVTASPAGYVLARGRSGSIEIRDQSDGAVEMPARSAALLEAAEAALLRLQPAVSPVPAEGGGGVGMAAP